jgi:hypothetical protein
MTTGKKTGEAVVDELLGLHEDVRRAMVSLGEPLKTHLLQIESGIRGLEGQIKTLKSLERP